MAEPAETDEKRPILVRIYPGPLQDEVVRLANQGRRPYQWQVELLLEKGIKALDQSNDTPKEAR